MSSPDLPIEVAMILMAVSSGIPLNACWMGICGMFCMISSRRGFGYIILSASNGACRMVYPNESRFSKDENISDCGLPTSVRLRIFSKMRLYPCSWYSPISETYTSMYFNG